MLAKVKLDQLKKEIEDKELDKKMLNAIALDLVSKKEVSPDTVPDDAKVISGTYDEKIFKVERDQSPLYFLGKSRYDSTASRAVRDYQQISLVEDFDTYYEEIKSLENTKTDANIEGKGTYYFVFTIAVIILLLGIIGGLIMFGISVEIGLAAIISTASFSAILFGIAKIIDLLSEQQK